MFSSTPATMVCSANTTGTVDAFGALTSQLATDSDDSCRVTLIRHISTPDANSVKTKGTLDGRAIPVQKDHLDYIREQQHLFYIHAAANKNKAYTDFITAVKQGTTLLTQ